MATNPKKRDEFTCFKPVDLSLFSIREYYPYSYNDSEGPLWTSYMHPDIILGHTYLMRIGGDFISGHFSMVSHAEVITRQYQYLQFHAASKVVVDINGRPTGAYVDHANPIAFHWKACKPDIIQEMWELQILDPEVQAAKVERNISLTL